MQEKKNKVNNYFLKIAKKTNLDSSSQFGEFFLKESEKLSSYGIDNDLKLELYKQNSNNFENKNVIKVSYLNYSNQELSPKYNLNKWKKEYYKIKSQSFNLDDAFNKAKIASEQYDAEEAANFLQWFRYYSKGEHMKYSEKKKLKLSKKGSSFGVVPNTNYNYGRGGLGSSQLPEGTLEITDSVKENMEKERLNLGRVHSNYASDNEFEEDETKNNKGGYDDLVSSLQRGLKSIYSNVMKNPPPKDVYDSLMSSIKSLTDQVHILSTPQTLVSVAYKTANKLDNKGINKYASEIRKLAQQLDEQVEAQADQAQQEAPQQVATELIPEESQAQSEQNQSEKSPIPRGDEVEPVRFEDIKTKGPEEGEYENLIPSGVNISDASKKLDRVASMLADRRVIRQLAEFDIMLDKLGIASMFPELAESQAKLIDAFGYALTRVTKMMGQLANAQTLLSEGGYVPGQQEAAEESPEG